MSVRTFSLVVGKWYATIILTVFVEGRRRGLGDFAGSAVHKHHASETENLTVLNKLDRVYRRFSKSNVWYLTKSTV